MNEKITFSFLDIFNDSNIMKSESRCTKLITKARKTSVAGELLKEVTCMSARTDTTKMLLNYQNGLYLFTEDIRFSDFILLFHYSMLTPVLVLFYFIGAVNSDLYRLLSNNDVWDNLFADLAK